MADRLTRSFDPLVRRALADACGEDVAWEGKETPK